MGRPYLPLWTPSLSLIGLLSLTAPNGSLHLSSTEQTPSLSLSYRLLSLLLERPSKSEARRTSLLTACLLTFQVVIFVPETGINKGARPVFRPGTSCESYRTL